MSHLLLRLLIAALLSSLSLSVVALPTLGLGPFGPGVQDGATTFNTDGNCASPTDIAAAGDDCGDKNMQVRTQDIVVFNWSAIANDYTPGQQNPKNVILEQILHPSADAKVNFERIPVRCKPLGGGGTNPASSIELLPNGDSKLSCNLGEFVEGGQISFSTVVKISGESLNGTTFTSTQRIYSNDDNGTANAVPYTYNELGPYTISARPMFDMSSSSMKGRYLYGTKDVGQGPEKGYWTYINVRISSSQIAGTEAYQQAMSFLYELTATKQAVGGADYTSSGFEYYMDSCHYNTSGWSGEVLGREPYHSGYTDEIKVTESGTCSYSRANPANISSPYTMTFTGSDLSGEHFPTKAFGNIDLTAGPYYFVNMRTRFFIPFRVIDNEDGAIDGKGSIYIKNTLKNFDPIGLSGGDNFAGAKEPGYNGTAMPDGSISNNIAQDYNYYLTTTGSYADYAWRQNNDAGAPSSSLAYFPTNGSHGGGGLLAPTQYYVNTLHFRNAGVNDLHDPRGCIAFDNSTLKLSDRGNTGGTAGTYAYVGTHAGSGFDSTNYMVEYGHIDFTGDNPLDKNHDGTNDFNDQTGRYEGDWTKQKAARCDDANATWVTDPTLVAGGIDNVNMVRVRIKDSLVASVALETSQYIRLVTPLQIRETFYQGPHDGINLPLGTVTTQFARVKTNEWALHWTPSDPHAYAPSPENGSYAGDRVTVALTVPRLTSESLSPIAGPGKTNSTIAGQQIIWKVNTAIQSLLSVPPEVTNVQIITELPPTASYNKNCTTSYQDDNGNVIGTPADLVEYNTDRNGNPKPGYTRLIWNLGTVTANTPITPRVICTDSDPLAPNGTNVIIFSKFKGDALVGSAAQMTDGHAIKLEQIGSIQVSKKVDTTLDDVNDSQTYTLSWANFAASFAIDEPTIIDVFPFNGDDGANSTRTPPSSFSGDLKLTAAPVTTWINGATDGAPLGTWYYTTDAPAGINYDPDNNTSNWVLEGALGGDFSVVTAIKFVSNYKLEKDGDPHQGMKAVLTLEAGDNVNPNSSTANKPGDFYTNIFTLDTASLPAAQFLRSNPVSVNIASYSVGDLIFADIDGDLKYTAGTDIPAPNGVVVELHKASDNSLVDTTTTGNKGDGRYLFVDVGSGDYYVTIPASQFASGATLEDWDSLVTTAGTDDDKNDDTGQDGYTLGTVLNDGVRTNVFTLSAIPPLPGQVPKGNEPLADNTGGIADTTADDFSNYTLDIGLKPALDYGDAPTSYGSAGHGVPITPTVYLGALYPDTEKVLQNTTNGGLDGLGDDQQGVHDEDSIQLLTPIRILDTRIQMNVSAHNTYTKDATLIAWLDFNNNGTFDASEAATMAIPVGAGGTKSLVWDNLPTGTIQTGDLWLRVRISTDTNLSADSASTEMFDGEVEDYRLQVSNGVKVSGSVFNDANVSTGIKETTDKGIFGVTMVLYDTDKKTCRSVKTDASGYYQFTKVIAANYTLYEAAKEAVTTPTTCPPNIADLAGYRSTTANSRNITVTTSDVTDQDFGDVLLPSFTPSNSNTVLPGNMISYPHTFIAQSTGNVTFTSLNSGGLTSGWSNTFYEDSNCNGTLESAEASSTLTSAIATTAGQSICLINKVFAPTAVNNGETFANVIHANFDFNNAIAGSVTLKVTDLTKAAANDDKLGSSKLELRKTVQNMTQNTAETATINQAKPAEILKYRIYYRNTGNGPLTDLEIKDAVPDFTTIVGLPVCDLPLPNSLTSCTPDLTGEDIKWTFPPNDVLKGGAGGVVSYDVKID